MLQIDYDIDDFIDYCDVKRLSKKTIAFKIFFITYKLFKHSI